MNGGKEKIYHKSSTLQTILGTKNYSELYKFAVVKIHSYASCYSMKIQLERQRLTWEDVVRKDVGALRGGSNWSVQALDWENWRQGCIFMSGWS